MSPEAMLTLVLLVLILAALRPFSRSPRTPTVVVWQSGEPDEELGGGCAPLVMLVMLVLLVAMVLGQA